MPVLTMPDLDTGADARPVPWQGMLWVTWRQHRGLLISILVAFVAVMVSMVIFGLKISPRLCDAEGLPSGGLVRLHGAEQPLQEHGLASG
jgi:hypothetical protein